MSETATAQTDLSTITASDVSVPALQSTTGPFAGIVHLDIPGETLTRIADEVDFANTNSVLTFGAGPQQQYTNNLMALLQDMKVGEAGLAGDITVELARGIDLMKLPQLKKEARDGVPWWATLPVVGRYASALYAFHQRKQELVAMIEAIEERAKQDMRRITDDNAKLDHMLAAVEKNYDDLGAYILGGELALRLGMQRFEELRDAAVASKDPRKLSQAKLFREQLIALDERLMRMKVAYVRAPVTGEKVMTTQQAGRIEIQNIMDSLLFDLPRLIEGINAVAALYNIRQAQDRRERRKDAAKRIDELSGEMMAEAMVSAKQSQGDALAEIEALETQIRRVIDLHKTCQDIDRKNFDLRRQAEQALVAAHRNFTAAMENLSVQELQATEIKALS